MLKEEMNNHLGYESNNKGKKETENRVNGYGEKSIKTASVEVDIKMTQDRDGSFNSELIPKA